MATKSEHISKRNLKLAAGLFIPLWLIFMMFFVKTEFLYRIVYEIRTSSGNGIAEWVFILSILLFPISIATFLLTYSLGFASIQHRIGKNRWIRDLMQVLISFAMTVVVALISLWIFLRLIIHFEF